MIPLFQMRALIWAITVLLVCVVAVRRGGPYERLASGGLLAAWAMTMLVYRSQFTQTEWGIFVVDGAMLALLTWIALRSARYWPLFAAGFHLLAAVTHVANMVDVKVGAWAYLTAEIIWGYLLAATIGYGAWTSRPDSPRDAPSRR